MKMARADGAKVAELRSAKGWKQEVLAERSGLSRGAIQRVEGGVNVLLDTLSRVASALGVSFEDLLQRKHAADQDAGDQGTNGLGGISVASQPTLLTEVDAKDLLIVLPEDFANWSDAKAAEFLRKLSELAGLTGSVKIVGTRPGSVKLTLHMTPEDIQRVMQAWDEGKLEQFKVIYINPVDAIPTEDQHDLAVTNTETSTTPSSPPPSESAHQDSGTVSGARKNRLSQFFRRKTTIIFLLLVLAALFLLAILIITTRKSRKDDPVQKAHIAFLQLDRELEKSELYSVNFATDNIDGRRKPPVSAQSIPDLQSLASRIQPLKKEIANGGRKPWMLSALQIFDALDAMEQGRPEAVDSLITPWIMLSEPDDEHLPQFAFHMWYMCGRANSFLGKWKDAAHCYSNALLCRPTSWVTATLKGHCQYRCKEYQNAASSILEAIDIKERNALNNDPEHSQIVLAILYSEYSMILVDSRRNLQAAKALSLAETLARKTDKHDSKLHYVALSILGASLARLGYSEFLAREPDALDILRRAEGILGESIKLGDPTNAMRMQTNSDNLLTNAYLARAHCRVLLQAYVSAWDDLEKTAGFFEKHPELDAQRANHLLMRAECRLTLFQPQVDKGQAIAALLGSSAPAIADDQFRRALNETETAIELWTKHAIEPDVFRETFGLAHAYRLQGLAYLYLNELDKAVSLAEWAIKFYSMERHEERGQGLELCKRLQADIEARKNKMHK